MSQLRTWFLDAPISTTEIRELMKNRYDKTHGGDNDSRQLMRNEIMSYGMMHAVVYALHGSPPKGYALYIPEHRCLTFYDVRGLLWRVYGNARVIEEEVSA